MNVSPVTEGNLIVVHQHKTTVSISSFPYATCSVYVPYLESVAYLLKANFCIQSEVWVRIPLYIWMWR